MTVQSAIESELPFLRAEAEARMTSTAIVRRAGTPGPQDETTGLQPTVWTIVYAGPFRLGASSGLANAAGTRRISVGPLEQQVATKVGHFPTTVTDLIDGDYLEVTTGECAGLVFRLVESDPHDQTTARRYPLHATDRPTDW